MTNKSLLLLLGLVLLAGLVLWACRSSAASTNQSAQAPPTRNAAPPGTSTPGPGGKPGAATPPNSATGGAPKELRLAEPKAISPAPTVAASGNGPRIAFANEEIDFGNVAFGDVVRAAFEFKNVGNEPLKILKAQVEVVEGC